MNALFSVFCPLSVTHFKAKNWEGSSEIPGVRVIFPGQYLPSMPQKVIGIQGALYEIQRFEIGSDRSLAPNLQTICDNEQSIFDIVISAPKSRRHERLKPKAIESHQPYAAGPRSLIYVTRNLKLS